MNRTLILISLCSTGMAVAQETAECEALYALKDDLPD
jgi:hypothetical protein